ncbi:PD-(D/E)XK nuclease family protein, partial [Streptomyces sp. NPDC049577]|uniref:PD-(D/E)XK nuclease family protein n=1 Tax=Streptomyces sp. NPDC049577 TaxID=3155153 RepID=UPI0034349F0F
VRDTGGVRLPDARPCEGQPGAQPKVLPHALRGDAATLPDVTAWDTKGLTAFKTAMKEHQHTEELRLGYVTFTRPRSLLLASGHWWGPSQKRPRGPSAFLEALREHCEAGHGEIEHWAEPPAADEENPALAESSLDHSWPLPLDPTSLTRRRAAAEAVLAHLAAPHPPQETHDPDRPDPEDLPEEEPEEEPEEDVPSWEELSTTRPQSPAAGPARPGPAPIPHPLRTPEEERLIASWDRDLEALAGELRRARATVRDVHLPPALSASQLVRLAADPEAFARDLARPMPRAPQPAARRGTRFHAWVESRYEELTLPLLGPDELPGGAEDEPEIADERDLAALKEAFERTPYARRTPYRVEVPIQVTLAGRVIRGRIDAVYRESTPQGYRYEIVDWKTTRARTADPLQLAIYRLAWAERQNVPLSSVTAAFVYVRTGETVSPPHLPDRPALERILMAGPPAPPDAETGSRQPPGAG